MKKWNLVIDVARCHDCNDCFLADKDEFVDNEWLPTTLSQPRHGHRWMNIERKERAIPHRAGSLPADSVPALPGRPLHECLPAGTIYRREDGLVHHRSGQGQRASGDRGYLPVRRHLLE